MGKNCIQNYEKPWEEPIFDFEKWDLINEAELSNYEKYMKVLGLEKYINSDSDLDFGKRKYALVFLNTLSLFINSLCNLTENKEVSKKVRDEIDNYVSKICNLMENIGYTYNIEKYKEELETMVKKDIEQTYKNKRLCFAHIETYLNHLYFDYYNNYYLGDLIQGWNYPKNEMCRKK